MKALFVTGTGTEVGKTLVALGLCLRFKADYWKPVQTGLDKDSDFIKKFLTGKKIYPCSYDFRNPLSPNQAAKKEGQKIKLDKIKVPKSSFLIIEGAGGVLVPLNDKKMMIDLIQKLGFPVIVVAKSGLGTLNHTLLTLEALKARKIKLLGLILSGSPHKDNKRDIEKWGCVPVLLELPVLKPVNAENLLKHFKKLNPLLF